MDGGVEARSYDRTHVFGCLEDVPFCSVATLGEGNAIHSRIMLFACDEELREFFLLTDGSTEKVAQLREHDSITLTVHTPADELDDHAETIVQGKCEVIGEFEHDKVQMGLPRLAAKSPMLKGLMDAKTLANYVMLHVRPKDTVFRRYRDILANVPKTRFEG